MCCRARKLCLFHFVHTHTHHSIKFSVYLRRHKHTWAAYFFLIITFWNTSEGLTGFFFFFIRTCVLWCCCCFLVCVVSFCKQTKFHWWANELNVFYLLVEKEKKNLFFFLADIKFLLESIRLVDSSFQHPEGIRIINKIEYLSFPPPLFVFFKGLLLLVFLLLFGCITYSTCSGKQDELEFLPPHLPFV